MRGDLPEEWIPIEYKQTSPPRARGSTWWLDEFFTLYIVSPACAGIYRRIVYWYDEKTGLPRVRGDLPDFFWFEDDLIASPPRARGSTS